MRAGYNLARWLLRNDQDAEDVTQEAIVRAFRFVDGFNGDNPRAWLLTVVRNSAYTFLQQNRARELGTEFDEVLHGEPASNGRTSETPEVLVLRSAQQRLLNEAVDALPVEFREAFVLREMSAAQRPTAAPLRLALRPSGADVLAVRLLKRRGPPLEVPLKLELPPVLGESARQRAIELADAAELPAATFVNLAAL